ncbi:MAG: DUF1385 domain-containing protein [Candidatus Dormibacteria bacterium]
MQQKFFYGGQAVLEGVMMRGRTHYAVAARHPDGSVVLKEDELKSAVYRSSFWRLPLARGVAAMWEMLHLGYRSLTWSATVQAQGEQIEISQKQVNITMGISLVVGTAIFVGLPLFATGLLYHGQKTWQFTLLEGLVRVVMLLGYLALIALLPDIKRVFEYHGAEHKTINCYEADEPVDVEHVRTKSLLHPRCGTGFLLVVALIAVLVFTVADTLVGHPTVAYRIASRVLLVPVVASLAFEFIRLAGAHRNNPVFRLILVPVMATQKLTTREPADDQIEVAIAAFTAARAHDLILAA